jgi:hypothetical protein
MRIVPEMLASELPGNVPVIGPTAWKAHGYCGRPSIGPPVPGPQGTVEHRVSAERRACREGNSAAELAQIPERNGVELHGKWLVEDRQKVRIVVDAAFERAIRKKLGDEPGVGAALAVGGVAEVVRSRFKARGLPVLLDR